jgi:hypothetical protein
MRFAIFVIFASFDTVALPGTYDQNPILITFVVFAVLKTSTLLQMHSQKIITFVRRHLATTITFGLPGPKKTPTKQYISVSKALKVLW